MRRSAELFTDHVNTTCLCAIKDSCFSWLIFTRRVIPMAKYCVICCTNLTDWPLDFCHVFPYDFLLHFTMWNGPYSDSPVPGAKIQFAEWYVGSPWHPGHIRLQPPSCAPDLQFCLHNCKDGTNLSRIFFPPSFGSSICQMEKWLRREQLTVSEVITLELWKLLEPSESTFSISSSCSSLWNVTSLTAGCEYIKQSTYQARTAP